MRKKAAEHNDPTITAELIRKIRISRHLTQKELAVRAGITEGYVRKIEATRNEGATPKSPSLPVLVSIAVALDVSLDSLWNQRDYKDVPKENRKQPRYDPEVAGRLIYSAIENKAKEDEDMPDTAVLVEGEIEIDMQYLIEIKRGKKTPSFELLTSIADTLRVSLDSLVFE